MNILRFIFSAAAASGNQPGKHAFWYVYVQNSVIEIAREKAESYILKRGWIPEACNEIQLLPHQISQRNAVDFPMAKRAVAEGICGECYSGEELELLNAC